MKKVMQRLVYLFLINFLFIAIIGCTNKSKPLEKENKIITYLFNNVKQEIPEQEHSYILIPSASCGGCRKQVCAYFLQKNPKNESLIVTSSNSEDFVSLKNSSNFIIDANNVLDKLNWDYGNIIKVSTKNGTVIKVEDYTTEEVFTYFR